MRCKEIIALVLASYLASTAHAIYQRERAGQSVQGVSCSKPDVDQQPAIRYLIKLVLLLCTYFSAYIWFLSCYKPIIRQAPCVTTTAEGQLVTLSHSYLTGFSTSLIVDLQRPVLGVVLHLRHRETVLGPRHTHQSTHSYMAVRVSTAQTITFQPRNDVMPVSPGLLSGFSCSRHRMIK